MILLSELDASICCHLSATQMSRNFEEGLQTNVLKNSIHFNHSLVSITRLPFCSPRPLHKIRPAHLPIPTLPSFLPLLNPLWFLHSSRLSSTYQRTIPDPINDIEQRKLVFLLHLVDTLTHPEQPSYIRQATANLEQRELVSLLQIEANVPDLDE